MSRNLTACEKTLCLAIIPWLRDEMITRLEGASPSPDLLYDLAQSNFEYGCAALAHAGVFASEKMYWRVLSPPAQVPTLPIDFDRTGLDDLLDAVACHSDYVDELYRHYDPIEPSSKGLTLVCMAMTGCKYMEATSEGAFFWTDNFGPWLVRHGAWDLTEFSPASNREVEQTLALIPDKTLELLSGSLCSHQPDFVRCFFARWFEGKWNDTEWRQTPNDSWDLSLAAGLYLQLHQR